MTTTCEHRQIYNATRQCTECGAKMADRRDQPNYLLSGSSPDDPKFLTGFEVIYDCEDCDSADTSCGRTHRGEYLNAEGKSRRD
jgi:hypothetical protein